MTQPLKCVSMLSLKEIALRRLVVVLWNDSDILVSVMKLQCRDDSITEWKNIKKEWESVIDRMKNKIMKLELPESLTKRMVDVVTPIGVEMRGWAYFHVKTFNLSHIEIFEQDSAKVFFTTAGTVDDRRMAQEIVRCDKMSVVQRYKIACSYWLEDYIPVLWQELSEEHKEFFCIKNFVARGLEFSCSHICKDGQSSLDSYFRKSDGNLTSFNQWAFEHSAIKGFKATVEYFFQKLSYEEREASLMRSAYAVCSAHVAPNHLRTQLCNVLHYLLSLMNHEQQTEIVKAHPVMVMSCFFEWSRRELHSENACFIWPFLSPTHYDDLLEAFFSYDPVHHTEFFKESPLDFKKYVAKPNYISYGLSLLFIKVLLDSEDRECIELFFRSADVETRLELVSDHYVLRLFYRSMARGKWRLVEVCLREATQSTEDRKKLKEAFLECLNKGSFWSDIYAPRGTKREGPQLNERDPKLKSFFDFLDGTDASAEEGKKGQKRKLENCSPE